MLRYYYLAEIWNERARNWQLVKSNIQGRNLGTNRDCPAEYARVWWGVWAASMTDARARLARGEGDRHS